MKRPPMIALLGVAVLAVAPFGFAVAWEADSKERDWRNDPRPALETVKCANVQEAWLARPESRLNIDMSHPGAFRWSLTQVHAQMVALCK
ncbi:MAG: hypothetical protein EOP14_00705 [Pseudomonas sp.]|jgi:hypothetical protein|nr:MAG: hypothetical protein EOP14_00705 [Pseudomonas sp.]